MAAFDFSGLTGRGIGWQKLREKLDAVFSVTTGHSHDGTDSKELAAGAGDDTTIVLAEGVFSVKDGGIAVAKLAANAVETAKIKDANVTAAKLAADAVETAKIKDAQITKSKLAAATQSAHIADATAAAGAAPTKEEYDALVTKFNALLVACEKVFLATE
jgi:hypothetical protein